MSLSPAHGVSERNLSAYKLQLTCLRDMLTRLADQLRYFLVQIRVVDFFFGLGYIRYKLAPGVSILFSGMWLRPR